jgi:hypothetical protein
MGSKLRLQYPGAVYHVTNRGDRREDMFADDEDRRLLVQPLGAQAENRRVPAAGDHDDAGLDCRTLVHGDSRQCGTVPAPRWENQMRDLRFSGTVIFAQKPAPAPAKNRHRKPDEPDQER